MRHLQAGTRDTDHVKVPEHIIHRPDATGRGRSVIQALPTYYKGQKFRSRLEARWAVFFDALSIKWQWQYEPEGFKLPSGACYLPDFYLYPDLRKGDLRHCPEPLAHCTDLSPDVGTFIEIKPNDSERLSYQNVFTEFSKHHPLVVLVGEPWNGRGWEFISKPEEHVDYFKRIYAHVHGDDCGIERARDGFAAKVSKCYSFWGPR